MLVTIIPLSLAASISTILYPVANTPMYFSCGDFSIVSAVIGVLLVRIISAFLMRSRIFSSAVLSYIVHSPSFSSSFQLKSPGLAA